MSTAVTNNTAANSATSAATGNKSTSNADAQDRFLKLLVTQMQNQDPLNPMDNAQVTSQMAQINTVTGIEKLNTTMAGMSTSMASMQMLQGSSLVGNGVLYEGNQLFVNSEGKASAGYELEAAAGTVRIDVVNSSGTVVDSFTETGKAAGRQGFEWTPPAGTSTSGLKFQVTATTNGKAVKATPMMGSAVSAVNTNNGALNLELANGSTIPYSQVKAVS
jgi:flagellar basal-body rod modification protein FlgD